MEAKHTPAPWFTDERRDVWATVDGTDDSAVVCIATVNPMGELNRETESANARMIAAAPGLYDLVADFGDGVTDMFEQLTRGNWTDDHGHSVTMNVQMMALKPLIIKAIELRALIAKGS